MYVLGDAKGTGMSKAENEPLLRVEDVEAIYGGTILALRGVSLEVAAGSIVALLGANGAGKTTTLEAISRLLPMQRGEVTAGRIWYQGQDIVAADPADLVALGLVQVLEGRHCFAHLSVQENLIMGAAGIGAPRGEIRERLESVYAWFPRLRERRTSKAGYTSGGEQQMVAIGRALMARPRLVLLDEPSMGLAPRVVEEIFEIIGALHRQQGTSFLIAEQNAAITLEYASYAYIVENGRIASGGSAGEIKERGDVQSFYLGGASSAAQAGRLRPRRPEFALEC